MIAPETLNSAVNLPAFCRDQNQTGWSFKRMPVYGWFASRDGDIRNLFDFFHLEQQASLLALFSGKMRAYLDSPVPNGGLSEQGLASELLARRAWKALYLDSRQCAEVSEFTIGDKRRMLKNHLVQAGFPNFYQSAKPGLLTAAVAERFKKLLPVLGAGHAHELRNKLLVPTWATPSHLASLEVLDPSLGKLRTLWTSGHPGWIGDINGPMVCKDAADLGMSPRPGFAWHANAAWWADCVLELSPNLTPGHLVKIWSQARDCKFAVSPLAAISDPKSLQAVLPSLAYGQIRELASVLGPEVKVWWERYRQEEAVVGGEIYRATPDGYFDITSGSREVTNFTVNFTKVSRDGDAFVRHGIVRCHGRESAFAIPDDAFANDGRWLLEIRKVCLAGNMGLPVVHEGNRRKVLRIIEKFNEFLGLEQ